MKIAINDNRKISEIQDEFSKAFPFLKLEFFSKTHTIGAATAPKFIIPNSKKIDECRVNDHKGEIIITPEMVVSDLEQQFIDIYGLAVQIFRKSGKVWLETTVTDSWTLFEQNKQGQELSQDVA